MRNRRAVTLIEMLIVVVMIGLMTAMSLPKLNYTSYRVDSGARALRTAMQRAQTAAVGSQHNMLVAIDPIKGELYVVDDINNNLTVDAGERVIGTPLQDGVKFGTPPGGVPGLPSPSGPVNGTALMSITVHGTALSGFVFRCDGAASSDVQIYLTSKRGLVNDNRAVSVIQSTGRVDWYKDSPGGTWSLGGF